MRQFISPLLEFHRISSRSSGAYTNVSFLSSLHLRAVTPSIEAIEAIEASTHQRHRSHRSHRRHHHRRHRSHRSSRSKTWRVEDVVGDAAGRSAPNKLTASCRARQRCSRRSKNHSDHIAWSNILNDDEIMELCKLSNELNACETTAILNPSKFASCATRLGLHEGPQP